MTQLAYLAPSSAEEAAAALARDGARPLSGGTDLLVQLRAGRTRPAVVVDLKAVAGAIGVREQSGGFVIGAATPGAVLGEHAALSRAWPGVVEGATLIGSTQVQGRASLGGNLCNASPAADGVPALIAARATCVIVGPGGRREAPVESIATGPGQTSLAPGEFVLEFRLPPRPARASDAYLRLIPRTEMDIAVAGAGVNLVLDEGGRVAEAHVAVGAVAPTALLAAEAGRALVGGRLDDAALAGMEAAVRAVCRPISDKRGTAEYRTRIAGVLARRAALIAFERAGGVR
ncbi:MAG: xanthine dehydrogenase family protein subunit M [Phenylobacterium sp.]|uniref:FAD binding domain-containing protein n=1 Tax=Phenylobacterium sp. TaxID=1871053 RepID=UPI001A595C4F|nr:xanthine dehydrogenase family protein subunit M [Phenylobacterium sp.]MBL8770524.1 xanthine dehydrogenase family protein subunit M [Phenylobacterium sp.]